MSSVSVSHFSTVRCLFDAIYKRKLKFLTKLEHSENKTQSLRLFKKHITDGLNIVHKCLFS